MNLSLLTWLLILWAALAGVMVLLLIFRGVIAMHEDDQLYLSAGEQQFARENADTIARQEKITPWIRLTGYATGGLAVVIAGVWLVENWSLLFA